MAADVLITLCTHAALNLHRFYYCTNTNGAPMLSRPLNKDVFVQASRSKFKFSINVKVCVSIKVQLMCVILSISSANAYKYTLKLTITLIMKDKVEPFKSSSSFCPLTGRNLAIKHLNFHFKSNLGLVKSYLCRNGSLDPLSPVHSRIWPTRVWKCFSRCLQHSIGWEATWRETCCPPGCGTCTRNTRRTRVFFRPTSVSPFLSSMSAFLSFRIPTQSIL